MRRAASAVFTQLVVERAYHTVYCSLLPEIADPIGAINGKSLQ